MHTTGLHLNTRGSSPHARGTRYGHNGPRITTRFIPACAGNAPGTGLRESWPTVHPRMRGERLPAGSEIRMPDGSSPHARGTPDIAIVALLDERFIPACAGNAAYPQFIAHDHRVHPRMRGERTHRHKGIDLYIGSSPHARGTHPRPCRHLCPFRFIPACAGNARALFAAALRAAVHPRMRGERSSPQLMTQWPPGSSPLARGTRRGRGDLPQWRRGIPAGAGPAGSRWTGSSARTVHPRMRGERVRNQGAHYSVARFIPACAGNAQSVLCGLHMVAGSSPHARGTPHRRATHSLLRRFIPACAGNACHARQSTRFPTVHPRMRGERTVKRQTILFEHGSSPHARGTHFQ